MGYACNRCAKKYTEWKDQTCYVVNESLIQETDMSVKLVANILQESSSLQVTNVLQKRVKWNKNS